MNAWEKHDGGIKSMNRQEMPKLGAENEATANIKLRAMSGGDGVVMED
jgi:hypothetical protein